MADLIPLTKNQPAFSQNLTLDGSDYVLHLEWNMRGGWFLGLADGNDDWIFTPKRMTVGTDMLAKIRHDARTPPGKLLVLDIRSTDHEPGYLDLISGTNFSDLQGSVGLFYVPAAEL